MTERPTDDGASALSPPQAILRLAIEVGAVVCWAASGWEIGGGGAASWALAIVLPLIAVAMWGTFRVPGDQSANGDAKVPVPGLVRLVIEFDVLVGAAVVAAIFWNPVAGALLGGATLVHYATTTTRVRWLMRRR